MPGLVNGSNGERKRKRIDESNTNGIKTRKAPKTITSTSTTQEDILLLEEQILESREHYNNIVKLQAFLNDFEKKPKTAIIAAVALCRVFCRLIASERLMKRKQDSEGDAQVLQWLKQRLREYVDGLTAWTGSPDASQESTAVTLLMRIVKEETSQSARKADQVWRSDKSTFRILVSTLLQKPDAEAARQEFVEKYVEEHDDVRFYAMLAIKQYFLGEETRTEQHISNTLDILSKIEGIPQSEHELEDWYGYAPEPDTHQLFSLSAHRKIAQECWLSIFRSSLTPTHRKTILQIISSNILPWFSNRMEALADFLTDSFNAGGSLSLLALSGIFKLMTEKNMDYPEFYTKLYSLLDEDVLHSKHRPRFFRLLDQFMSSSHLPAAMVASFLKRLSRLSLHAPPGAIVWIIPWTYNMLRRHPSSTFLLHRPYHPAHSIYTPSDSSENYLETGVRDPFSMAEPNPMLTHAINSSLWELHTLTDHYHPNVATLANILSEPFTKRDYALEDFVDHGYGTLLDAELGREMKRGGRVEVEWEIPKRIITAEDAQGAGMNALGSLLENATGTGA